MSLGKLILLSIILNGCVNGGVLNHNVTTVEDVPKIEGEKPILREFVSLSNGIFYAPLNYRDTLFIKNYKIKEFLKEVSISAPEIVFKNRVIYKADPKYVYYKNSEKKFYCLVNSNSYYLILPFFDPPQSDKWHVVQLSFNGNLIKEIFTPNDYLSDLDNDGQYEVGGRKLIDAYCVGCDSGYYNPPNFYELGATISVDSSLIKEFAIKEYGGFYGYEMDYNKIVPVHK